MLKKRNKMVIFLFLLPIIDFLSFLNPTFYYIQLGVKGILVFYALIDIAKKREHTKILLALGIYFLLYLCYIFTVHSNPLLTLSNTITIFSFPLLILYFTNNENEKVTKKTMLFLCILYTILYLICLLFHLKMGVVFFPLFVILIGVALIYILESQSGLLKVFFFALILLLAFVINAKTFYISLSILILYFIIANIKKIMRYIKQEQFKSLLFILVLCLGLAVYIPQKILTKNNLNYTPIKAIFSYENGNELLGGRLEKQNNIQKNYKNSEALEKVMGLEIVKLENNQVEIDIFDLFYSIGILGVFFYCIFFFYVLHQSHLQKNYAFIFGLLLILSCLGNVLANPYVLLFLSLLFLISKNDHGIMKKDILMVSNMYPNETHPHYGIFVKNTYEILNKEYSLDLVVMYKTEGKIKKLLAYIKVCGVSLLKAMCNNYDFIYVHFISHTTAGVFLPAIMSRAKLVLNVHGNDLVPDTEVDENYMWLSRLFLKGADKVIVPSKYFANIVTKDYNIPKEKVVIYPSGGVDLQKFKKINKKTALKKVGLDGQYQYFGYAARIEKDKGYDTYIKAINELNKKKKAKDLKFLLIGSGSEEEKCNALIKKYKLENKIIRKSLVSQEELVNYYNALEAFIYPTRMKSESLGLTGLEAMACEVLVIGSNKYGPSDYLINEENSFTFSPSNYKELAEKMEMVLKMNAREKKKYLKNARKKSEEYSNDNTKDTLLNVFKKKNR